MIGGVPRRVDAATKSAIIELIDLTVAVSVSAGVAALQSLDAFHGIDQHRVALCLFFVALLTAGNLRGLKESGKIFAAPTYIYITVLSAMVVYGLT